MGKVISTGTVRDSIKERLQTVILNNLDFPWYYNDNQVTKLNDKSYPGFSHVFLNAISQSSLSQELLDIAIEILKQEKIPSKDIKGIYVIRSQLLLPLNNQFNERDQIHHDMDKENFLTILYYVNDSDGPTKFYDNDKNLIEKVEPVAGKYIVFKSNTLHAASLPKLTKKRITISFVLEMNNG